MPGVTTQTNAPPEYLDQMPAYQYAGPQSSPLYSDKPDASELVLQSATASTASSTLGRADTNQSIEPDYVYKADHMEVNVGSRVWGLRNPTYGLQGHIEGFVKLLGEQAHVTCVGARLQGDIIIRTSNFGQVSGQESVRFLRKSITLYSSNRQKEFSTPWDKEHRFSFELPTHVVINDQITLLPASFTSYLPATYCEISYVLKVDMTRKGFRRHETIRIPISYLPKSRPSHPSIMDLPWPPGNSAVSPFHGDDSVRTEALSEYWPLKNSLAKESNRSKSQSIYLSLPSATCFASGEHIPFVLSLVFPDEPALPALLTPDVQMELIKRTRITRCGGLETAMREITVGRADIRSIKETVAGVTHLRGVIQAGKPGRENSWNVYAMADVQYIVRTTIHPPKSMLCNLPSWKVEIEVQLTTDLWGTLDSELTATGGIPTPALALAGAAPHVPGHPTLFLT